MKEDTGEWKWEAKTESLPKIIRQERELPKLVFGDLAVSVFVSVFEDLHQMQSGWDGTCRVIQNSGD